MLPRSMTLRVSDRIPLSNDRAPEYLQNDPLISKGTNRCEWATCNSSPRSLYENDRTGVCGSKANVNFTPVFVMEYRCILICSSFRKYRDSRTRFSYDTFPCNERELEFYFN